MRRIKKLLRERSNSLAKSLPSGLGGEIPGTEKLTREPATQRWLALEDANRAHDRNLEMHKSCLIFQKEKKVGSSSVKWIPGMIV